MSQPVRRGPGRPRKQAAAMSAAEPISEATPEPAPEAPAGESDPRIGQECDPAWSSVGYEDGRTYLCQNGKIVERVI